MFAEHVSGKPLVAGTPDYEPEEAALRATPTGGSGWRRAEVRPFNRCMPGEAQLRTLICGLLEVLEGRRTLALLRPRLEPRLMAKLATQVRTERFRSHRRLVGLAFRLVERSDALEVWGTARQAQRTIAFTARIELDHRRTDEPPRWLCTAFDLLY